MMDADTPMHGPVRMLLIGAPGSALRRAAELAVEAGAEVAMADAPDKALERLRSGGADLAMIDVDADIPAFMAGLRAERFTLPVLACGIDAPAERAVAAIRAGARDYVPLPPQRDLIAAAIAAVVERRAVDALGDDPALRRARDLACAVAPSAAPVLIVGPAGSGKEVMARTIHAASGRPDPMVVAECAGIHADVLESELFGHEQGAFLGAVARRAGRLEQAGGGTLFLREVGALSPMVQARLLRVLQDRELTRVGGGAPVPFRARLIASTGMDLAARVREGQFRADLLARLGLVRIEIPPLSARGEDIALLARHFAERLAMEDALPPRRFSDAALLLLRGHGWPGNVREMEDMVHRAMLLARGAMIEPRDLVLGDGTRLSDHLSVADMQTPPGDVPGTSPAPAALPVSDLVGRTVEEVERALILQTLARCRGNRTSASGILGISVRTMRNKLKAFVEAGIPVAPSE